MRTQAKTQIIDLKPEMMIADTLGGSWQRRLKQGAILSLVGFGLAAWTYVKRVEIETYFYERFSWNHDIRYAKVDDSVFGNPGGWGPSLPSDCDCLVFVDFGYPRGWVPYRYDNMQMAINHGELAKYQGYRAMVTSVVDTEVRPKAKKEDKPKSEKAKDASK